MKLLKPALGSIKKRKRVGRGSGSGMGKTCSRGENGQKSRSGYSRKLGFEGGQMPLARRVPKRGFTSRNKKVYQVVNLKDLQGFLADAVVVPAMLEAAGVIRDAKKPIKILGVGMLDTALEVHADAVSTAARTTIETAGGKVTLLKRY